jgi:hypothetical protein
MENTSGTVVTVWIGDTPVVYIVDSAIPGRMVIHNANDIREKVVLLPLGDKWRVDGDNDNHPIDLYQGMTLTNNPVIDARILSYLDDQLLEVVCTTSKYTNRLCSQPPLWLNKIDRLYPGIPSPTTTRVVTTRSTLYSSHHLMCGYGPSMVGIRRCYGGY